MTIVIASIPNSLTNYIELNIKIYNKRTINKPLSMNFN